jgi:adenosylhomocysteine nucleosidase
MKIGILGAMPEEIEGIISCLSASPNEFLQTVQLADRDFHQFRTPHHEITLVFSRWGKVASATTATTLINRFKVDIIIFTGVAGAAHAKLNVGDIVVGKKTIQHDMDTTPLFPKFQIPLTGVSYFDAEPALVELAIKAAHAVVDGEELAKLPLKAFNPTPLQVYSGTLASGDQFIADKKKVVQLAQEIDSLYAVDMESASVAQVCSDFKLPFVAIRIISDKADGSAPVDFAKFTAQFAGPLDALIIKQFISTMPNTN